MEIEIYTTEPLEVAPTWWQLPRVQSLLVLLKMFPI